MIRLVQIKKSLLLTIMGSLIINQVPLYAKSAEKSVIAPITWERSSEQLGEVIGVEEGKWNWQTAQGIETPITSLSEIWDAPYKPYYSEYISEIDGKVHSSATWETQNEVDLRRFRGHFEIPEGYTTEDFVRLKSVIQEEYNHLNGGNIIPINDNIYVFVYPEEVSELINDDVSSPYYFMNYLAMWTGTANRPVNGIQSFYGREGTYAERDTEVGLAVTDGWYAEATIDNIGSVMHATTSGAGSGSQFVIDLFTEDNSPGGGGGMDEMILEFKENPKADVSAVPESYAIPSGETSLIQEHEGLLANEGENGIVTSEIMEGSHGEFTTIKTGEMEYEIYKGNEYIAQITYIDHHGQFAIRPEENYIGDIQFEYEVKDKLGQVDIATASLYVIPYVEVNHRNVANNEELLQVQKQYGNPYEELPSDILWMMPISDLQNAVDIQPLDISLLEQNKNYSFVEGSVENTDFIIQELPYEYIFEKNNDSINLEYEVGYKDSILYICHEYEGDTSYQTEKTIPAGATIQAKDYVDTTVNHLYGTEEKYEVSEIQIMDIDEATVSKLDIQNIKLEDFITLVSGKNYKIIYQYKLKENVGPEVPEEPEIPVGPEVPVEPETPVGPEVPVEPETPVGPEVPVEPETPEEPEVPVVPEEPTEPEQPDDEVEIPDEEVPIGPINPGVPTPPQVEVPDDEVEIPDEILPGSPSDINEEVLPDDEEIEIPDEQLPNGPISPDVPNMPETPSESEEKTDVSENEVIDGKQEKNEANDNKNPQTGDRGILWKLIVLSSATICLIKVNKKQNK